MRFRSTLRSVGVFATILVLIGLVIAPSGATPAQAQSRRPVMAFYYPWYEKADWENGRMSDVASPKYSGGEEATLLRHIQQADDAGIDALVCNPPWGRQVLPDADMGAFYRALLGEAARVLRPGGRAVLLTDRVAEVGGALAELPALRPARELVISLFGSHPTIYVLEKE
ncbi:hypothetical protein SE17_30415 [Kouleothrix aurantiaca]|uniref:Ribosomal RNA large subunit methyltransferase K/L-like methyltransferase domain-containing protein n=1 Tax=Kouleothrix aurantiaca TaxID=186479 RepID=A0A0N8PRG1_9CHLR|nr:hypothetical protein SE17_30415 [Kouleothrix aurantiaca]